MARALRERVHRWVGIPTCVGIAPTKTLPKVANFIAKKRPQCRGVCDLPLDHVRAELLPTVPVRKSGELGKLRRQSSLNLESRRPLTWPRLNRTALAP